MTTTLDPPSAPRPPEAAPATQAPPARATWLGAPARLAALVVLGAVLRLWGLGASRLNYDESFTAMAGRLPLSNLFAFLRAHDSHPPLDYLLRAPIARVGASEFWLRAPSVVWSVAALALFAWWMRSRGRMGLFATALMGVSAFEIIHGREARMYAELELLGIGVAVLASTWHREPRRWHAPLLAGLVLAGLLTHVSMFLLAAGMVVVPGRRTDPESWRWRGAVGLGVLGWALLWGRSFLTQAAGGHSAWIPPTSLSGLETAISRSLTFTPSLVLGATVAVVAGGVLLARRAPDLGWIWVCCFAVPIGLAAVAGLVEPVVLDRTFTLMAWAPCLAVATLLDAIAARRRILGVAAFTAVLALLVPSTVAVVEARTGPDTPLRQLAREVRPGDVVAVRPAWKAPELAWALGVRGRNGARPVAVTAAPHAYGLELGTAPPTGRTWLLDWRHFQRPRVTAGDQCARRWSWGQTHIRCLELPDV